jgi:pilus assembly protein CpaB
MRTKALLALLFVFSIGLVAVLVIRAMPSTGTATAASAAPPAPPPEVRMILAAASPLASGTLLRAQDVTWRAIEGEPLPGQIARPALETRKSKPESDDEARAEIYGAALRGPLAEGEPIQKSGIVKPGDRGFVNAVLDQGTRAITISVAMGPSGTGLVFPGDRVDLILTQNFKNEDAPLTRRSVSETVAEGLRILAIDKPDPKAGGAPNAATRTVTIEVQPAQAEKISVAAELGKLSLTVRSSLAAGDGAVGSKPTWAGDVSPALRSAVPPAKAVQAEKAVVKVMRGNRSEDVKPD